MEKTGKVKMTEKKDGWQCWVDIFEDHVVKIPKKRKEIEEIVTRALKADGKLDELEYRVNKMISDVKNSTKIIQNTDAPKEDFGSPKFNNDGTIFQQKAIELSEFLQDKSEREIKEALTKLLDLIKKLWEFGIHEKTFKFFTNYGIIDDEVIMMDFLEITDKKETAKRQIIKGQTLNKSWNKPERFARFLPKDLVEWFSEKTFEEFSLETFEEHWKRKSK